MHENIVETKAQLLLKESPLQLLPTLAYELGLNEAIFLQQTHYFLVKAEESNYVRKHRYGRWWFFDSYPAMREKYFPFWSVRTIQRTVRTLEKMGIINSAYLCDHSRDRRKWYTIDYDALSEYISKEYWNWSITVS